MKEIIVRSPTRVDLAGGTLDLWPLYNFVGGAQTINVAIDIYTQAKLIPLAGSEIQLHSKDIGLEKRYQNVAAALADPDPALSLLQEQIRFWQPRQGFRLETSSESPIGGGLGGSSSLTISILRAFANWLQRPFQSTHELVRVAHNLEAAVLRTPTGTQDYYPAASGGINILTYSAKGIEQKVLPISGSQLQQNFLLVYTGKSHHSGMNNFEVLTAAVQGNKNTLSCLQSLKSVAEQTITAVENSNWEKIPDLFQSEYRYRVDLAKAFTSVEIQELSRISLANGAQGVKICGAGGGGCVLVWVPPLRRQEVGEACQKAGYRVLDANPVEPLLNSTLN